MGRATAILFGPAPVALGRGQKVKYHNFILSPGSCSRGGTFGRWGCPGGQKIIFFKHGHVLYQIVRDDEQNRI